MNKKIKYRQGDVSLHRISKLPSGLKMKENNVLAYGEITGHEHRLKTQKQVTYVDRNGNQFVELEQDTELIHDYKSGKGVYQKQITKQQDKHLVQTIQKGIYAVKKEREEDVFSDVIREVAD